MYCVNPYHNECAVVDCSTVQAPSCAQARRHHPLLLPQVSLAFEDIRNEKVKVLRSMRPVSLEDTVLGQYRSRATAGGKTLPGYLDDKTVPPVRTGKAGSVRGCGPVRCGMHRRRVWTALAAWFGCSRPGIRRAYTALW